MKMFVKRLGLRLSSRVDQYHYYFDFYNWKKNDQITATSQQQQILLMLAYRDAVRTGAPLPRFDEVEFRSFSQHGEDGILWFIFCLIGTTNKRVVEICAGDGVECNSANLIVNHRWKGLLFDGDPAKVEFGRAFYTRNLNTLADPPELVHAWIDADGIDSLVTRYGFSGEVDLLSLDMDGVDYWVYKSLSCISPRVIVLEYNASLGPHEALTVPYNPQFRAQGNHWGASLPAFVKLCRQRGYRLVGCDTSGINAFFIRSGIAEDLFAEVSVDDCYRRSRAQSIYEHASPPRSGGEWITV